MRCAAVHYGTLRHVAAARYARSAAACCGGALCKVCGGALRVPLCGWSGTLAAYGAVLCKEISYMPLAMAKTGEIYVIKKVGGNPETRKFLESLGFVNGTFISIISFNQGNVIVSIKDSRVAIDKSMAMKITV